MNTDFTSSTESKTSIFSSSKPTCFKTGGQQYLPVTPGGKLLNHCIHNWYYMKDVGSREIFCDKKIIKLGIIGMKKYKSFIFEKLLFPK